MNTFRFERDGAVGKLILGETPPAQANADFPSTLHESIRQASKSDIRVLVLSADGGTITVGGDPNELLDEGGRHFNAFIAECNASFRLLEGLRVPTVASVARAAVGGGFELVLACDFLVVAASAALWPAEAKVGMAPVAGGVQRLAERVGRARATRIVMLGEAVTGPDAVTLGIATHVAPADRLEQATAELAQQLATGPTLALAAIRGLLKAWSAGGVPGADVAMPDLTADLFDTEDARKGMGEFLRAGGEGSGFPTVRFAGK